MNLLVEHFMDVVAAEGPIHVELAARRWGQTVGYRRVSKRIYDGFIQTVVGDAKKRGLIELRGKFILELELPRFR